MRDIVWSWQWTGRQSGPRGVIFRPLALQECRTLQEVGSEGQHGAWTRHSRWPEDALLFRPKPPLLRRLVMRLCEAWAPHFKAARFDWMRPWLHTGECWWRPGFGERKDEFQRFSERFGDLAVGCYTKETRWIFDRDHYCNLVLKHYDGVTERRWGWLRWFGLRRRP